MTTERVPVWDGEPVEALAAAWAVPVLEAWRTIGSTNDRALELARSGAEPFATVVADEQSVGRGRRGRPWTSEAGSGLLMSVVAPAEGGVASHLPLLAGLAVARGIEAVAPGLAVRVKWPNDLLVGDRKLAGVLCEGAGGKAVIGVGLNVSASPAAPAGSRAAPPTSLEAEGASALRRSGLAVAIVGALRTALEAERNGLSPSSLAELSARDGLRGRAILTESAGAGTGGGFTEDGALRLLRPDGSTARVVAGSVRLR